MCIHTHPRYVIILFLLASDVQTCLDRNHFFFRHKREKLILKSSQGCASHLCLTITIELTGLVKTVLLTDLENEIHIQYLSMASVMIHPV